ncbi:MAG: glycosyltransferase [Deltaproteobacteria bacterium]|nr:glycosyltransferase [Deltaproteobacteria bacterium]
MTAPITFAIPFHRDIDLLRLAVESVLAQTSPDWQLLVCDDSGLDLPVEAMLSSYAEPRISYIENSENIGTPRRRHAPAQLRRVDALSRRNPQRCHGILL